MDSEGFRNKLYMWYASSYRSMPWKGIKDPYKIWLSEVILQQTRVEQGLPYYEKFVARFPNVKSLAEAGEDEVMKLWQGLGYYSRARNMLAAARYISEELDGIFPSDHKRIRALKGVGDYTAAAISSFAFNEPYPVLDGNVFRVLSRIYAIDEPVDTTAGKKLFTQLSNDLIDTHDPAKYNQAMMDFGATLCKPRNPLCSNCPFMNDCKAYRTGTIENFPVKKNRVKVKEYFINYLVPDSNSWTYLRKRKGEFWEGLYEFPSITINRLLDPDLQDDMNVLVELFGKDIHISEVMDRQQILSHRKIKARFIRIINMNKAGNDWIKIEKNNLQDYALPRIIDLYLGDYPLSLV